MPNFDDYAKRTEPNKPAWVKAELNSWFDRQMRAIEMGKHRTRLNSQDADINNNTPRNFMHYRDLRKRLFAIKQRNSTEHHQRENVELLRHLIVLSRQPENYPKYKTPDFVKFSQRIAKMSRKAHKKKLQRENDILRHRLEAIQPAPLLKKENLADSFARHKRMKKIFLASGKNLRNQPDIVLPKKKKRTRFDPDKFMSRNRFSSRPSTPGLLYRKGSSSARSLKPSGKKEQQQQKRPSTTEPAARKRSIQIPAVQSTQEQKQKLTSNKNSPKPSPLRKSSSESVLQAKGKNQTKKDRSGDLVKLIEADMSELGIATSPKSMKNFSREFQPKQKRSHKITIRNSPVKPPKYLQRPTDIYTNGLMFDITL